MSAEGRALSAEQIANGQRMNELDQARADQIEEFISQLEDMVSDLWRDKRRLDAQIKSRADLIAKSATPTGEDQP